MSTSVVSTDPERLERPRDAPAAVDVAAVTRVFVRGGVERAALKDVSFRVERGRTLAVVGESGAGKSTLCRLLCGLDQPTSGRVLIAGAPPVVRARRVSSIQMVFQSPTDAMSPHISVGASVAEPLWRLPAGERRARVAGLFAAVGIDPSRMGERPKRFSGGQLQRLVIARALAVRPEVLLCDEPTSALDVSVQAQIVNLLLEAQREAGFACVLVTHDLHVAKVLADDVAVLRHGEIVEQVSAASFFAQPQSEYGRQLMGASRSEEDR